MLKKIMFLSLSLFCVGYLSGQNELTVTNENLPYYEIPDYPDNFSPGNIVVRLVDGLGYRYFWATEGLQEANMSYKPSDDSRTIGETLEHIYILSRTIKTVVSNMPVIRPTSEADYTLEELRIKTLENIQFCREALISKSAKELEEMTIVFQRGEKTSTFPFWNLINGQIADAIYHSGQIVAFRRAAGNPVDPRMNVFTGKMR